MKIVRLTLRIIICILCFIIALAFLGIEGFALISAEWMLYENSVLSFVQQMIKVIASAIAGYAALMSALNPGKSRLSEGVFFLVVSVFATVFLVKPIGIVFVVLCVLFVLTNSRFWRHNMK